MILPAPAPPRSVLLRVVRAFVSLRRHEGLTLHQAVQGLRTSGMPWLLRAQGCKAAASVRALVGRKKQGQVQQQGHRTQRKQQASGQDSGGHKCRIPKAHGSCVPRSLAQARRRDLLAWVWWLMADLVAPLLRACFYATETEPYKQEVFYYRWGWA